MYLLIILTQVLAEESSILTNAHVSTDDMDSKAYVDHLINGIFKSVTQTTSDVKDDGTKQFLIIMEHSDYIQTLFINNLCQNDLKQKLFWNSQIWIGDSPECRENTLTQNVLNEDE